MREDKGIQKKHIKLFMFLKKICRNWKKKLRPKVAQNNFCYFHLLRVETATATTRDNHILILDYC